MMLQVGLCFATEPKTDPPEHPPKLWIGRAAIQSPFTGSSLTIAQNPLRNFTLAAWNISLGFSRGSNLLVNRVRKHLGFGRKQAVTLAKSGKG
jgi:hypothetical protein